MGVVAKSDKIFELVERDVEVERLATEFTFTEGPIWHPVGQYLLFSDMPADMRRRERLLEAGVAEEELERISGPCGLDVGADSQPETALSILAKILAVRARRDGGRLQQAKSRIHVEVGD